jgi:hypothetical protein
MIITRQQIGLILTLLGTVSLAFSIRTLSQYDKKTLKEINPDKKLWAPTQVEIVMPLFWGGLVLVSIGTALQW